MKSSQSRDQYVGPKKKWVQLTLVTFNNHALLQYNEIDITWIFNFFYSAHESFNITKDEKLISIVDQLFKEHKYSDEVDIENQNPKSNVADSTRKRSKKDKKKNREKEPEKDKVRDIDWSRVAERFGQGYKSSECLRRYNKISGHKGGEKASAVKGPWTEEEDQKIITLVKTHGARKWSLIAAELPGKYWIIILTFVSWVNYKID